MRLVELTFLGTGGTLCVVPHTVFAIHKSPQSGHFEKPGCVIYAGNMHFHVSGTVEDIRNELFPAPKVDPEEDELGEFIKQCTEPCVDEAITARNLYDAYTEWCEANAYSYQSQSCFSRSMSLKGVNASAERVRKYAGLRLTWIGERSKFRR